MSGESEPARKPSLPRVVWPSLFIVFAGLVTYLNYQPPLETARPEAVVQSSQPPPRTVEEVGAVYSRLWEDPLEAPYRDQDRKNDLEDANRKKGASAQRESLQRLAEDRAKRIQQRFRKIVQDSREAKYGNKKLLFMPVLLPGGPHAEDKERRMRIRYALLAALGTCHYELELGDRMSYVTVPVTTRFNIVGGGD